MKNKHIKKHSLHFKCNVDLRKELEVLKAIYKNNTLDYSINNETIYNIAFFSFINEVNKQKTEQKKAKYISGLLKEYKEVEL